MEKHREMIFSLLQEIFQPRGIYERSDVKTRELEGLPLRKGPWGGEFDPVVKIREGDASFWVDLARGQKTGFFLDQRENRLAIRRYVTGKRVLDAFTYTGGFAIHATLGQGQALAGAQEVRGVDASEEAIEMARKNAALNGVSDRCVFEAANAFDYLKACDNSGEKFDVVILDPPAFAKSKEALQGALRGYKEINLRAMKILQPGGILVTASCSHYVTTELFRAVIASAARDARRTVRILEIRRQSVDHPVLLGVDETDYLKCFFLQVL